MHFEWTRVPPNAPLSIHFIDRTIGFGIFAERDLTEGEFVGEYTGLVKPERDCAIYTYLHAYSPLNEGDGETPLVVDSVAMGNETRFINHADSAKLLHRSDYYFNGHWHVLYMVAADVAKGEQLLINYGEGYWKGQHLTPLTLSP